MRTAEIRPGEQEYLAEVGMRVKLARVRRRQSQNELAQVARISRVTLGALERGEHPSSVLIYVRLARTLGFSLDELLEGEL